MPVVTYLTSCVFDSDPVLAAPPEAKKDGQVGPRKDDEGAFDVKPPVKHVLSKELQVCCATYMCLL